MAGRATAPNVGEIRWDEDALLDPHVPYLEEGRKQGRQEGLAAGYQEGYSIGETTGLEYGLELGFIRGVVETVQKRLLSVGGPCYLSPTKLERVKKALSDISALLDDFPRPSEMLSSSSSNDASSNEERLDSGLHDDVDDEQAHGSATKSNVQFTIQRIRSRFKLLTVLLGMPHFSLSSVMDDARDAVPAISLASAPSAAEDELPFQTTTEW